MYLVIVLKLITVIMKTPLKYLSSIIPQLKTRVLFHAKTHGH